MPIRNLYENVAFMKDAENDIFFSTPLSEREITTKLSNLTSIGDMATQIANLAIVGQESKAVAGVETLFIWVEELYISNSQLLTNELSSVFMAAVANLSSVMPHQAIVKLIINSPLSELTCTQVMHHCEDFCWYDWGAYFAHAKLHLLAEALYAYGYNPTQKIDGENAADIAAKNGFVVLQFHLENLGTLPLNPDNIHYLYWSTNISLHTNKRVREIFVKDALAALNVRETNEWLDIQIEQLFTMQLGDLSLDEIFSVVNSNSRAASNFYNITGKMLNYLFNCQSHIEVSLWLSDNTDELNVIGQLVSDLFDLESSVNQGKILLKNTEGMSVHHKTFKLSYQNERTFDELCSLLDESTENH